MAEERALLVIADIGGYTRFMNLHRTSLAHAEATTAKLLKRIVDAARGFELIEIEGDAAFLSRRADDPDAVAATTQVAVAMHQAFHAERQRVATNMCPCQGCELAADLTLKFVAHVGEVAEQTIKRRRKLVGIDVIFVHRLLKNSVPVPEYVLMSEALYLSGDGALSDDVREVSEDLEGIGPVRTYFVDVGRIAGPPPALPEPSVVSRLGATVGMLARGVPYRLGLKRRRHESPAHAH
jgi:Protein of unknown function (DUF2652)